MTAARGTGLGRGGAAAIEFAIVAAVFVPLCLAVLEVGLLVWAKGALQSTASLVARCAAIGSPNCTNAPQYAVTTAGSWIFPGIISASGVTPAPAVVCISHTSFMEVTITCSYWGGTLLPAPFNGETLTAVAYFPTSATSC